MKYLFILIIAFIFVSCKVQRLPIKGDYPNPPISEKTTTGIDSVWSNLIDYIARRGMSIKVIDKSSGLLVTEDYSFDGVYTYEKKKGGGLVDPAAFLVTDRIKNSQTKEGSIGPARILGNWNVRLKPEGQGTSINVNITNLRTFVKEYSRGGFDYNEYPFTVKTTGVFEKMIIDNIK